MSALPAPPEVVVVLCTAPRDGSGDKPGAEALARRLVEERLCACVNVLPGVRSVFRWQGAVDVADEHLLVLKTTAAAAARLRERLLALHPYEVPEVLELPVAGGSPPYLRWLADGVASASAPDAQAAGNGRPVTGTSESGGPDPGATRSAGVARPAPTRRSAPTRRPAPRSKGAARAKSARTTGTRGRGSRR